MAVVGDKGAGKTSLITSAAQEVFSERPVPVLPPTRFPADFAGLSEPVDLIAYDTSSRPEDTQAVDETVKAADVVVLCFDAAAQGHHGAPAHRVAAQDHPAEAWGAHHHRLLQGRLRRQRAHGAHPRGVCSCVCVCGGGGCVLTETG